MKVLTFSRNGQHGIGILDDQNDSVTPFNITEYEARKGVMALIDNGPTYIPPTQQHSIPLSELKPLPPIPYPRRNIFCVGKNYLEHAEEFSNSGFDVSSKQKIPEAPIIFSKVPESVISHMEPIRIDPRVSSAIDYEAELAVIIGTGGKHISREDALDHIWGYTIVNDVTARDLQKRYSQWLVGKSQDTFCPMGPVAVTRDDIDLSNTKISCWVNGELRQSSNTSQLIFDIGTIIETISAGVTLVPGDVIATGTPAGVGIGFTPPKYMKHGDVVKLSIENIGTLENSVVEVATS